MQREKETPLSNEYIYENTMWGKKDEKNSEGSYGQAVRFVSSRT